MTRSAPTARPPTSIPTTTATSRPSSVDADPVAADRPEAARPDGDRAEAARPDAAPTDASTDPADPDPAQVPASESGRLLRIQEAAAEVGLTARSIRYYEELGLLRPAARSGGDYRLYDPSDLERLRFIKGLRDDAGFSLAEIGQLLEDEAARQVARARFREAQDPAERRAVIVDTLGRVDRQIDTLRAKAGRLAAMIEDAESRRQHLQRHLAEIEAGQPPHELGGSATGPGRASTGPTRSERPATRPDRGAAR